MSVQIPFPSPAFYNSVDHACGSSQKLLVLVVGWSFVSTAQGNGVYLEDSACSSFTVRFGDYSLEISESQYFEELGGTIRDYIFPENRTLVMFLSSFSGTYRLGPNPSRGKYPELEDKQLVYYGTCVFPLWPKFLLGPRIDLFLKPWLSCIQYNNRGDP